MYIPWRQLKLLNVHLAVMHAQLDYVLEKTEDIRGFNTLVMVPDWANIAFSPRLIVAMDGMLSDGERVLVKEKFAQSARYRSDGYADAEFLCRVQTPAG